MTQRSLSEFADRVGEIMPVISNEYVRHMANDFNKLKITLPQFFVLELLSHQGDSKMSDMAKAISVTTAAVTGVVNRLVRDGYVCRTTDPRDRRIVIVKLTGAGTRIVKQMIAKKKEITIKIFGMASQGERESYLRMLAHIHKHLLEQKAD